MSGPIPQLVDISHALQSGIVQQIRSDVIQYSQLPQLSEEQVKRIDAYLQAINSALTHFTIDNQHIERVDDGVTDLDIQLYNGLRSMYTDYMTQLTALKLTKSPYAYQQQQQQLQQGPIQLQVQLPNQQQQQQQQIPIIQNPGLASQAVNAINDQFQFHPQSQSQYQYQPQPQPQPQQPASAIQGVPMMVQPEGYNPIQQQQQQQQQQQPMLSQPQQEFQAQSQAEQQTQGIADDDTAKKTLQERKEQRAREEERRINENIKILEYIHGELPYKKPSERRKYIDTLAENETKVPLIIKSEEFLDSMSKLCALDIDNAENIRSYIRLLKMLGYSKSKLRASLPQSLTAPSPSPSSSNAVSTATSSNVPGDNTANIVSSTSSVSSSSKTKAKTTKVKRSKTKTESKTDKTTASKSRVKQRDIPPIEVYIADKKDKDTARVSSPSSSSSSSVAETASSAVSAESASSAAGVDGGPIPVSTQGENDNNNENGNTKVDKSPDDGKLQEKASEAQNRKKISFSNYLKKEDSKDHTVGTKRSLETDKTSTTGTPDDGTIRKKVKSTTEPYTISSSSASSGLKSILKNSSDSNAGAEVSSRKNKAIRFQDDSDLVRVYGDGLPSEGLKVLPKELKKLLRPFKAGVPNEKLLLGDFIQKPRPLHLDIDVQNSDISETKGGPVPCDTKTPPYYRENFRNFHKKLTSPPSERLMDATFQDPALLQEELGRSPIIAGAFGRNRLLLRSDRGGIPYRNVPVVTRNKYPPRYTRPSRAV